jgi:AmpE protein
MTLMIILVCLALQRYFSLGETVHQMNWFTRYIHFMNISLDKNNKLRGILKVVLLVLPLTLIVGLLDYIFHHGIWHVVAFLLSLLVLMYCFDAHDLRHQLSAYFSAAKNQDHQSAYEYGAEFVAKNQEELPAAGWPQLIRDVTRSIFLRADRHVFAVIFWFVILGPTAALFYRLVLQLSCFNLEDPSLTDLRQSAKRLQAILDWIPVRITGLTYALAGNFNYAFSHWWPELFKSPQQSQDLAYQAGLAALEIDQLPATNAEITENEQALNLVDRTLVIWLVIIAIFTLGAWIA